jgi:cation diffusion facilitator family transporter
VLKKRMSFSGSKKIVIAALIGNGLIAVTKFTASFHTGSSAMLSEGVHSVVDTCNQALLLYGIHRSNRPADKVHPFGYAREIYFWAFIVAILIFAVGAGVSIYEGITKLYSPRPVTKVFINYIVLGSAFVFEACAWWLALCEFKRVKGKMSYWEATRKSKDPTLFTVLFEDTAAMVGIAVAFLGILFGEIYGLAWMDGAASITIGVILTIVASLLAYECKGLLVGESASDEVVESIQTLLEKHSSNTTVNELLTMQLGPNDVLVTISLDFAVGLSAVEVARHVSELETMIKSAHTEVKRVFIEAQSFAAHMRQLE